MNANIDLAKIEAEMMNNNPLKIGPTHPLGSILQAPGSPVAGMAAANPYNQLANVRIMQVTDGYTIEISVKGTTRVYIASEFEEIWVKVKVGLAEARLERK